MRSSSAQVYFPWLHDLPISSVKRSTRASTGSEEPLTGVVRELESENEAVPFVDLVVKWEEGNMVQPSGLARDDRPLFERKFLGQLT